jgi:hypothetical protein
VAQSEAKVAQLLSSSSSKTSIQPLAGLIEPLLGATETKDDTEDIFQARVCLGWIHATLGEPKLAVARLPESISWSLKQLAGSNSGLSLWTYICAIKAAYIKGQQKTRNLL